MIKCNSYRSFDVGLCMLSGILLFITIHSCGGASSSTNAQKEVQSKKVIKTPSDNSNLGDITLAGENLNVTQFLNGDRIVEAKSQAEWSKAHIEKTPAFCYSKEDNSYGKKEVIYNYYAVSDPRGICVKEKMLSKSEMDLWLKKWNGSKLDIFADCMTIERSYEGKFYDLGIVNWWLIDSPIQSEENGLQAYVLGWTKEGDHASIQKASTGSGFFVRCKK